MMKSNLDLDRSRKGVSWDQAEQTRQRLLRMPEVMLLLPLQPEVGHRA
jgi:thymidylate kinase